MIKLLEIAKKTETLKKDICDRNIFDRDPHQQHNLWSIDRCLMKNSGHYFETQARKMKRWFFGLDNLSDKERSQLIFKNAGLFQTLLSLIFPKGVTEISVKITQIQIPRSGFDTKIMDIVISVLDPILFDHIYSQFNLPSLMEYDNWIRQSLSIYLIFLVVWSWIWDTFLFRNQVGKNLRTKTRVVWPCIWLLLQSIMRYSLTRA